MAFESQLSPTFELKLLNLFKALFSRLEKMELNPLHVLNFVKNQLYGWPLLRTELLHWPLAERRKAKWSPWCQVCTSVSGSKVDKLT